MEALPETSIRPLVEAESLARLSQSSTTRSRPTARGPLAQRAKRPGERSERLWTHGDNRRRPQTRVLYPDEVIPCPPPGPAPEGGTVDAPP